VTPEKDRKDIKLDGKVIVGPGRKAYRGTEDKLRTVLETYAKPGCMNAGIKAAGIPPATHYRRLEQDEVYRQALEDVERTVSQEVEDTVYQMAVEDRDLGACTLLLRRFRPQHYRDRGGDVQINVSIEISERLESARQRLIEIQRADSDE